MSFNYAITYCGDRAALHTYLAEQVDNVGWIVGIDNTMGATWKGQQPDPITDYVITGIDMIKPILSADETKSLAIFMVRDQSQLDALTGSPIEVLAVGDINTIFDEIQNDAGKLAKYSEIWTADDQANSGFKFTTIN